MTYVIAQPCVDVKDKACVDECPVDCIYEGKRMLYIHPDECVDCGACEPVCPVEAIFYEDDTPEQWKDYSSVEVRRDDFVGNSRRARIFEIKRELVHGELHGWRRAALQRGEVASGAPRGVSPRAAASLRAARQMSSGP